MTLKLTPRDVTQPRFNQDVRLLYDVASRCFGILNEKINIFSSFQLDLFKVTFHFEERSIGGNTSASSLSKIVKSIELQIKVVNRYQEDVEQLVDGLLALENSTWLLVLQPPQEATEYDAVMAYSRGNYHIGQNRTASGALYDESVRLVFSNESHSAYSVDLTGPIRDHIAFTSNNPEEITVDDYEPVQETLKCPAVSFPLTSPMATEGRDRDPPDHSQHSHSQTADRPGVVMGRMLHSVDQDTGQVVVSLDTHTGTLHHKASGRTLSFQHVQLLQEDGVILVCSQQLYGSSVSRPQPLVLHRLFSWHMIYVSVACQSLSVVCLFLVFFTYCVFGELRTLPGKNTLGLVTSLLLAMLLFEVRGWLE